MTNRLSSSAPNTRDFVVWWLARQASKPSFGETHQTREIYSAIQSLHLADCDTLAWLLTMQFEAQLDPGFPHEQAANPDWLYRSFYHYHKGCQAILTEFYRGTEGRAVTEASEN